MKILFIEADKYLDNHQEDFERKLKETGNEVLVICDCYNKAADLKSALTKWKPDVIFIQTTFVYADKIKSMVPLSKWITYPVELWYAGNYSAGRIIDLLPEDKKQFITGYDIWMHVYSDTNMKEHFKKPCY